jgi:hypothetical protein
MPFSFTNGVDHLADVKGLSACSKARPAPDLHDNGHHFWLKHSTTLQRKNFFDLAFLRHTVSNPFPENVADDVDFLLTLD